MPRPDPARPRAGVVRCAVYTRKSSEEGLEQDFNSLHAQREACEAYVHSQKHEGWVVLPAAFDDGGLSGGTMERPALHRLLDDIRAGRVDTVVVYKVDRLTRSLSDFARIVDIFDAQGVAFVSVTQHFNTTSSMGRLTLNVLLSFAQFEREVAGERIRDKIALSKQKGMWMGGNLPLGYDVRDRKLVVNEQEAATVRHIYARYLALGSVRLLREELDAAGIGGKQGRGWSRGALYHLLRNRLYRGEIAHKERVHPGQHEAIVDRELWDRVQAALASPCRRQGPSAGARAPSLLAGLLFDGSGAAMTASHAVKDGKRYRYYLSRPLLTGSRTTSPDALRLPAPEIERVVCDRVQTWLADPQATWDAACDATAGQDGDPSTPPHDVDLARSRLMMDSATALAQAWPDLSMVQQRTLLAALIRRVEVHLDHVAIHLVPARLDETLRRWQEPAPETMRAPVLADSNAAVLIVPVQLRRIERARRLVITDPAHAQTQPNPPLLKLLAQAHHLQARLLAGEAASFDALARHVGLTPKRAAWVLRLSWLAPSITDAILHGRQPATLTADRLARTARLPLEWDTQRRALGFN